VVLHREIEPAEEEELGEPLLLLSAASRLMGGRETTLLANHLEEPGRSVAQTPGLMADVDHRGIALSLETLALVHDVPPRRDSRDDQGRDPSLPSGIPAASAESARAVQFRTVRRW
jgi:hypothetical protein